MRSSTVFAPTPYSPSPTPRPTPSCATRKPSPCPSRPEVLDEGRGPRALAAIGKAETRPAQGPLLGNGQRRGSDVENSRQRSRQPSPPLYQLKAEFFKTLAHPVRIRVL